MRNLARGIGFFAIASSWVGCSADEQKQTSKRPASAAGVAAVAGRGAAGAATGAAGVVGVGVGTAGAGSASACPLLRPVEDGACTRSTEICTYDEIDCQCPAGLWVCAEPVDPNCPAMMPAHGAVCTVPEATECEFLQDECECRSGRWSCESAEVTTAGAGAVPPSAAGAPAAGAGVGAAGMSAAGAGGAGAPAPIPMCPDMRPIEGFACTAGRYDCNYDTTHCVCPSGMWLCSEGVDPGCPIEPPAHESQCAGTADCDYFDIECECSASRWSCKAND